MWHVHPGEKGKMKITTREWIKELESFGWGKGKEAVVAKNKFMEQLEPLRGRRIGYQHDIWGW